MNSFNRRKDDLLNDLHSAEGRHNSSEIIDLEKEIEIMNTKQKINNIQTEEIGDDLTKNLLADQRLAENKQKIIDIYLPLFTKTYDELKNISDTPQLEECKKNARAYIQKNLEPDFTTDVNEIAKITQLSKGERFLFSTTSGEHMKMETGEFKDINRIGKKTLENFKNANNIKKQDHFMRLHIDEGANFTELVSKIYTMKLFLDIYKPKEKIRYGILLSRLDDSEFIEYFRKRLKENNITKQSNIIKVYDDMRNYLAKQGRLDNTPVEGGYIEFKDKFIIKDKDPNKPSSLNQALDAYEKEGKKLKEGCLMLDLEKLKKMIIYNR